MKNEDIQKLYEAGLITDEQRLNHIGCLRHRIIGEIKHATFAAIIGMGVGALAGLAYLMSGGQVIRELAPRWAAVIFQTGFVAGEKAIDLGLRLGIAEAVGVAMVGLTYAAIAVLIHLTWHLLKRKE